MGNPWFRMYADFLEDPKMLGLAFEDQRHFIGVLALKSSGTTDQECAPEIMDRIVAQKLWVDHSAIREVKRRLIDAGLITDDWTPIAWDRRQFVSDHDPTAAERARKYRERKRKSETECASRVTSRTDHADVTPLEQNRTDTETEKKGAKTAKRFRPPSVKDVSDYCKQISSTVNPEAFVDFYESKGWKVGSSPMKDWRAAVRNWGRRNGSGGQPAVTVPTGNTLGDKMELGRLCKTAGISDEQVAGKSCDQIRALLREQGAAA